MRGDYLNTTFEDNAVPPGRPGPLLIGALLVLMFLAGIAFGMSL